jgi:hypothetical protein
MNAIEKLAIVLSLPFCLDLFSCYLTIRRNHNKKGSSGIPRINLPLYWLIIFYAPFNIYIKALLFALTFLLHVTIVNFIPDLDRKNREKK